MCFVHVVEVLCPAVGAILGFALVHAGSKGVIWAVRDPGAFPPYKGVVGEYRQSFIIPYRQNNQVYSIQAMLFTSC